MGGCFLQLPLVPTASAQCALVVVAVAVAVCVEGASVRAYRIRCQHEIDRINCSKSNLERAAGRACAANVAAHTNERGLVHPCHDLAPEVMLHTHTGIEYTPVCYQQSVHLHPKQASTRNR